MQFPFKAEDIYRVILLTKAELLMEKPLVETAAPCVVVGDLNGQVSRDRDACGLTRVAVTVL